MRLIAGNLLCCFLLASCAQMVTPTGGPRDLTPPVLVSTVPSFGSVLVSQNKLELLFDEYVTVKDPNGQWIISPPLKNPPSIEVRGKRVLVGWTDTLAKSSTYSFQFGNSIADLHEGNIASGLKLVFSTGYALDSLKLTGKVFQTFTGLPEKGCSVWLYDAGRPSLDSALLKQMPDYVTPVRDDGSFILENLPDREFFIIGIKDANRNFHYDPAEEYVAFYSEKINPRDKNAISLPLFLEKKPLYVKKLTTPEPGLAVVHFSSPAFNLSISSAQLGVDDFLKSEWNAGRDSLRLFFPPNQFDTLRINLVGQNFFDTLIIPVYDNEFYNRNQSAGKKRLTLPSKPILNLQNGVLPPDRELKISWMRYPLNWNKDSLSIFSGIKSLPFVLKTDSALGRQARIIFPWVEDSTYRIVCIPGFINDPYSRRNDTLKVAFRVKKVDETGGVSLTVATPDSNANAKTFKVELTDEKGAVVNSVQTNLPFIWDIELLTPGSYRIRAIEDRNGNNRWDTGGFIFREQPERVFQTEKVIVVRPGWVTEERVTFKKQSS